MIAIGVEVETQEKSSEKTHAGHAGIGDKAHKPEKPWDIESIQAEHAWSAALKRWMAGLKSRPNPAEMRAGAEWPCQ